MRTADLTDRLDEILLLLAPARDHGHGGLTETRRKLVERLLKLLRDEIQEGE